MGEGPQVIDPGLALGAALIDAVRSAEAYMRVAEREANWIDHLRVEFRRQNFRVIEGGRDD